MKKSSPKLHLLKSKKFIPVTKPKQNDQFDFVSDNRFITFAD